MSRLGVFEHGITVAQRIRRMQDVGGELERNEEFIYCRILADTT